MKTYDKDAISRIEYRKNELERILDQIRRAVDGMSESFRIRIVDEEDKISEEKLTQMINDILEGYNRYRKNVIGEEPLNAESEELYKAFLYCVMVGPSIKTILPDVTILFDQVEIADKYEEIISMANSLNEKDRESLLIREKETYETEFPYNEFFDIMNVGVFYITGKGYQNIYSDEEKRILEDIYGPDVFAEEISEDETENESVELGELKTAGASEDETENQAGEPGEVDTTGAAEDKTENESEGPGEIEMAGTSEDGASQDIIGLFTENIPVTVITKSEVEKILEDALDEYNYDLTYEEVSAILSNPRLNEGLRPLYENDLERMEAQKELEESDPYGEYRMKEYEEQERRVLEESEYSSKCSERWVNQAGNPDTFIKNYVTFRRLYFDIEHPGFAEIVEKMIDIYLYEQEIAPISYGREYGIIDNEIRHTASRLRHEVRRRRALS